MEQNINEVAKEKAQGVLELAWGNNELESIQSRRFKIDHWFGNFIDSFIP